MLFQTNLLGTYVIGSFQLFQWVFLLIVFYQPFVTFNLHPQCFNLCFVLLPFVFTFPSIFLNLTDTFLLKIYFLLEWLVLRLELMNLILDLFKLLFTYLLLNWLVLICIYDRFIVIYLYCVVFPQFFLQCNLVGLLLLVLLLPFPTLPANIFQLFLALLKLYLILL